MGITISKTKRFQNKVVPPLAMRETSILPIEAETAPWAIANPEDTFTPVTELFLQFNDTTGGTTLVDSSPAAQTVGWSSGTYTIDPEGVPANSLDLSSTGSYGTIASGPSFAENEDFTWEFWYKNNNIGAQHHVLITGTNAGSYAGCIVTETRMDFAKFDSGGLGILNFNLPTTQTSDFNHFAFVRTGGQMFAYFNGVQAGTERAYTQEIKVGDYRIGRGWSSTSGGYPANGLLDSVRITRAARYTAPFTPEQY